MNSLKVLYCQVIIILIIYMNSVFSLYEDQVGKFDWKLNNIGKMKMSFLDLNSPLKKIYIGTEENVIAALNMKDGEILWRQILEKGSQGSIQNMKLINRDLTTISGMISPIYIRNWNPQNGHLISECLIQNTDIKKSYWLIDQNIHQLIVNNLTSEIVTYNIHTCNKINTIKVQTPWISKDSKCLLSGTNFVCIIENNIMKILNILTSYVFEKEFQFEFNDISLENINNNDNSLISLSSSESELKIIAKFEENDVKFQTVPKKSTVLFTIYNEMKLLFLVGHKTDENLNIRGINFDNGKDVVEMNGVINSYPMKPILGNVECTLKKDQTIICRIILSNDDHSITFLYNTGKIIWTREESLASIVAVEMIELPISDTDTAIDKEFDHKGSNIFGMFIHRLISQISQLWNFLLLNVRMGEPHSANQLIRDEFGLHKMILIATSAGKLYGVDSLKGSIVWQRRIPNIIPFGNNNMILYVQRTTRHFPYPAQCALLAQHEITGEGVLYVFNPFNGQPLDQGLQHLGYPVKQSLILHQWNKDFLRGIIIIDKKDNIHVYPEETKSIAAELASTTYYFTVDTKTGIITGYTFQVTPDQELLSSIIWKIHINNASQQIIDIVGKSPLEKVHSQGRVLGDRSVLYKYINHNLVAIVTKGYDQVQKHFINIFLLDAVSGLVVYSTCQKKARLPVHVVHSENWLVFSYYSEKFRRTEVTALELYEGKIQSNTTAFSSVALAMNPIVERQSYIMPASIDTMKETITEKGITSKHILVALSNGNVLELPLAFVDPRRPLSITAEMREEGIIPYMPELPIPPEAIINYNQSLQRINRIHTAPSGLESTSLCLIYGLDMFFTRVSPSKTFDVLKEDFDHFLISAVLLGLLIASYITRKLASKKALKQAWK